MSGLNQLLTQKGWHATGDVRVALLYLIGKGKSLRLPAITWRPICAVSRPIVPRSRLRLAARAFSCFLRVLSNEIIGCFHHHNVHSIASWNTWLDTWSCTHVTEADCKDQFNNVDPALVVQYLNESTEWLKTKRQWRAPQMCWSIHKADTFSLCSDNFCWAASSAWQRLFAIPMGGSFSAQSADLYCIWAFHLLKAQSRQWGELTTSPCGFLVWKSPRQCAHRLCRAPRRFRCARRVPYTQ